VTARVIGAYDVPAIWTRSDDEAQAAGIVSAAERTLKTQQHPATQARLLATIALESRGSTAPRAVKAAREAERIARGLDDPALLAFALNGVFMQTCHRAGLAPQRDAVGNELVALSQRHGLVTYEVLGHLIRLQACSALDDFSSADAHAAAADALAARHELPLVGVFTTWYRAMRADTEQAYRAAADLLQGAGMPGLQDGLLPLALACHHVRHGLPIPDADYGPYDAWVRPLIQDRRTAEVDIPDPPPGLLLEVLWCLTAHTAREVGNNQLLERARAALTPAAAELAAGSGLLTLGPVADYL
jgi:hypothetical protein